MNSKPFPTWLVCELRCKLCEMGTLCSEGGALESKVELASTPALASPAAGCFSRGDDACTAGPTFMS